MVKTSNFILFLLFVFIQIILSALIDFGPLLFISIYPLFLLTRPVNTSLPSLMIWAFITGLTVDYFSNTILGINSFASVMMVFFQFRILGLVCRKGDMDNQERPGLRELGFTRFSAYLGISILLHHMTFSMVESFGLTHFIYNLPRVIISVAVNSFLIILIEYGVFYKNWR
ncbi:MAG: hypothetical protein Q8R90_08560 [Bacteroidales bacterium]|nr:hypothetical protein [Bacteroidales bacterium]